ncbi:hypothetical protein HYPSUDRAFT_1043959 [Hypholoma sublateritium FD-334 SS-4]|uniref:Uncharacterized protein n=1 Tax=Hypholoma sublateritium (strain FD-334 SS-4) TaxID=945553 RepID=A0A0D2NKJ7_HYPSF|nr:hypothetical protein HYPSUDRAFT_1043959 [Hypholoma sublateritium FD-334 SS-4]
MVNGLPTHTATFSPLCPILRNGYWLSLRPLDSRPSKHRVLLQLLLSRCHEAPQNDPDSLGPVSARVDCKVREDVGRKPFSSVLHSTIPLLLPLSEPLIEEGDSTVAKTGVIFNAPWMHLKRMRRSFCLVSSGPFTGAGPVEVRRRKTWLRLAASPSSEF